MSIERIKTITSFLLNSLESCQKPDLAIVLGSGINFNLPLRSSQSINYHEIPEMPNPSVKGHKGKLVIGETFTGQTILLFSGRYHLYEGFEPEDVMLPVQITHSLGCKNILLTNSAGGIASNLDVADPMLITAIKDYQNKGNLKSERGLLDCIEKPPLKLNSKLTESFSHDTSLKKGIYAAVLGPNYETLSEIGLFKDQDCSAVGMSTYLEALYAMEHQMNVAAISVITNIWKNDSKPSHEEVLENSSKAEQRINHIFEQALAVETE